MKTLMTFFTEMMLIACAGVDHQLTMAALGSSAVSRGKRSTTSIHGSKAVTCIRYYSLKSPSCSCVWITLPAAS
jgi:hypothetical protein